MPERLDARAQRIESIDGREVDLLVIGGGITGAGVAREAAYRGISTLLAERGDYASGTSSRSSKLVHGGLRYLQQGDLGLVFEATNERQALQHIAPHLVRPLRFLYPAYRGVGPAFPVVEIGMLLYDTLSLFGAPRLHRPVGPGKARAFVPGLRGSGLRGGVLYYDARTDDARLTLETILDAELTGARCFNYLEVTALSPASGGPGEAQLRCHLTGATVTVRPRTVVVAAGPWSDRTRTRLGLSSRSQLVRGTRGSHLVLPAERLPLRTAVVLRAPQDDRVIFALPWLGRTLVGTTDLDYDGDPAAVRITVEEVDYLLAAANHYFPDAGLTPADVIATYSGVRPLGREDEGRGPSEVSREHRIVDEGRGVITVVGGKLTTYRSMAEEIVDHAVFALDRAGGRVDGRPLDLPPRNALERIRRRWDELADGEVLSRRGTTARRVLPGAIGVSHAGGPDRVLADLERVLGDRSIARHLLLRYGGRAYGVARMVERDPALGERVVDDLHTIWAEIPFAALHEHAWTLVDVLDRRTSIVLTARDQGISAAPRAAKLLAGIYGWDDRRIEEEVAGLQAAVERSRAWRKDQKGRSSSSGSVEGGQSAPPESSSSSADGSGSDRGSASWTSPDSSPELSGAS